jgi:hypothetical protein
MYRLQLSLELLRYDAGDATEPPVGKTQALIFRVGPDAQGRVHAGHSGSVKGTHSQFFDYFRDDVVVAVYANADPGTVDLAGAAESLAALYLSTVRASDSQGKAR